MCRFKAFHERYYHPSNARFWFYGDDPPAERLRLLAAYLDEFEAQPVDSAVSAQPLFQVRRHRRTYTSCDHCHSSISIRSAQTVPAFT